MARTQTDLSNARQERIAKMMEAVKAIQSSDDFRKVLQWQAAFHKYSFNNMMLIVTQRPDATRVAGFTTWKKVGRTVKKGAKGIMILAPCFKKNKDTNEVDGVYFTSRYVFDISDTEGEDMPELPNGTLDGDGDEEVVSKLCAFLQAEGVKLVFEPTVFTYGEGYFSPGRNEIYVKPASRRQMLSVLVHEITHYLDRNNKVSDDEKETIAEGTAYVFCSHFGIDTGSGAFPYIAGWSAREGGEKTIQKCLDSIQKYAKTLIDIADPTVEDVENE